MGEWAEHRPLLADVRLARLRLRRDMRLQGILQLKQMPEELWETITTTVSEKV